MASFCRFWRITPDQYRALTMTDYQAMVVWMNEEAEASRRGR